MGVGRGLEASCVLLVTLGTTDSVDHAQSVPVGTLST